MNMIGPNSMIIVSWQCGCCLVAESSVSLFLFIIIIRYTQLKITFNTIQSDIHLPGLSLSEFIVVFISLWWFWRCFATEQRVLWFQWAEPSWPLTLSLHAEFCVEWKWVFIYCYEEYGCCLFKLNFLKCAC